MSKAAEIQRDDNDIWIGQEHAGYCVKQVDNGCGCGACRAECKQIGKVHARMWTQESRVKEALDNSFLHYSGENWCDGNRTITKLLLGV